MRFQDAATRRAGGRLRGDPGRPAGRARRPTLLADATPAQRVLARAVMNGETTDPDVWRAMFPTPVRAAATGDAGASARSEAILAASLAVADRGEQVRSQVRGAIVEELTAQLLARRVGAAAVRRERRILFDGVPAEIHPYDVTVERDGAAEAYDCKWGARGINADVLHQLDDARTHAADEDERLTVALVVFDAGARARSGSRARPRRHEATAVVTIETLDELAGPRRPLMTGRRRDEPDTCSRAVSRPLRRGRRRTGWLRTSVLLRYTQDLAWVHSAARGFGRDWYAERGLTWLVRAAEVAVLGADPGQRRARRDDRGRRLAPGLGAPADRVPGRGRGARRVGPHRLGPARRAAAPRRGSRPSSMRSSGRRPRRFGLGRVALGDRRPRRSGRRLTVRPQELDPMDHVNNAVYADWLDEAVLAAGGAELVRAIPRLARLDYARAAEPDVPLEIAVWPAADGWSCRVAEADANGDADHDDLADRLRARLERLAWRSGRASSGDDPDMPDMEEP